MIIIDLIYSYFWAFPFIWISAAKERQESGGREADADGGPGLSLQDSPGPIYGTPIFPNCTTQI